ncbi:MAG TPA: trehalose-phosphatase [Rhodobacteraceae bacterium]|nr:trehalose-phosphatase [Paracoccaceae bacterium]
MSDFSLPDRIDCTRHAFFLDFDGTLAPIVARPTDARLAPGAAGILDRLVRAADGAVAVLSGRPLAEIDAMLAPLHLTGAGAHGIEIRGADGSDLGTPVDADLFGRLHEALEQTAAPRGLLLERKPGALALHYRDSPAAEDTVRAAANSAAALAPGLRAIHGKMVSEVTLAGVTKGHALRVLAATVPFAGRVPVMAGDDVTDEDGIRAAQELGGIGIRIGPGETHARYRARHIEEFLGWLDAATPSTKTDRRQA